MACRGFAGQLKDVAAGGEPTPRLRAHIEQCEQCREELAREQQLLAGIDADLVRALRVEPSADFEARTYARVASETAANVWFSGWRAAMVAASFAAVALVVAVVLLRPGSVGDGRRIAELKPPHTSSPTRPEPVVSSPQVGEAVATLRGQTPDTGRQARTRVAAARRPVPQQPPEPEVLVPPDQRIAFARLSEMVRTGKLDEKTLAQASEAPPPPAPVVVEELKVPPIVIAPAPPGGPEKQR